MYDYIIVGAGSAGCVLANRLSEDASCAVALIEAGGRDWHPFIHMPAGFGQLAGNRWMNWNHETEPEPELHQRRLYWPRGKILGGSSSINAMCYIRGQMQDYDDWSEQGLPEWSYEKVLPYFLKSEDQQSIQSEYHGRGGPLGVQDLSYTNELSARLLDAASNLGYPLNRDFNGEQQTGFGYYQVNQKNNGRCSTAVGYLRPARHRPNLSVLTRHHAASLIIEGNRVTGVRCLHRKRTRELRASAEVILAAGAINSPQIMMLSGLGPVDHLESLGLDVQHDLPGVGMNLQDHLDICTLFQATRKVSYDQVNNLSVGLKYLLFRKGIGTSNLAEAGGFATSSLAQDDRPDLQFHFVPALLDDHGRNRLDGSGFTLHCCALRPSSRGTIRLRSADWQAPPLIQANYLSEGDDLKLTIEGVRRSRELLLEEAFADIRGDEVFPGSAKASDEDITDFIRRKAESIYHPVGTCKMGVDEMAVVDGALRVHGMTGLRVVDASVMPTLTSGNTNAPTIMIAEKAADVIIG